MEDLNDQIQQRLKKLDLLRGMGVNPFGDRFEVRDRAGDLTAAHGSSTREALEQHPVPVTLAG
ncbi:MAG: lysine--tRNA ligase, partial [Nitrospirota bacterium]